MKPLRVFVADDEPLALRRVLRALGNMQNITVVGTASDGREALDLLDTLKPDLLILDIMMPGMTGIDLLAALDDDCEMAVIFVTAFDRFAVDAFEEGAVDYVLKPLDEQRLELAIERARSRLGSDANKRRFTQLRDTLERMNAGYSAAMAPERARDLWVREGGKVSRVRVEDIDWIEAAGDYVTLHIGKSSRLADDTIRSLVDRLDPDRFQQVHRGSIVRLDAIATVQREKFSGVSLKLASGKRVKVSKSHKRALLDRLQN